MLHLQQYYVIIYLEKMQAPEKSSLSELLERRLDSAAAVRAHESVGGRRRRTAFKGGTKF